MRNPTIPEMWTFLKTLARNTGSPYLEEVLREYSDKEPTYQEIVVLFDSHGMYEYYKYGSRDKLAS